MRNKKGHSYLHNTSFILLNICVPNYFTLHTASLYKTIFVRFPILDKKRLSTR